MSPEEMLNLPPTGEKTQQDLSREQLEHLCNSNSFLYSSSCMYILGRENNSLLVDGLTWVGSDYHTQLLRSASFTSTSYYTKESPWGWMGLSHCFRVGINSTLTSKLLFCIQRQYYSVKFPS